MTHPVAVQLSGIRKTFEGVEHGHLSGKRLVVVRCGALAAQCFFEKTGEDLSHLFADLSIWKAGADVRSHFQRYPVIHLTFRDVKSESFEDAWASIRKKIEVLFDAHRSVLGSGKLSERETRDYVAIVDGTAGSSTSGRCLT